MKKIAKFIGLCDPLTRDHQSRVSILAVKIGHQLALPLSQIENIRTISLIHDIGKVVLPPEFMVKTNKLSDAEREIVMKHPQAGYDILTGSNLSDVVKQAVLQHHERIDGSGYPGNLKGRQILPEAKVVAVADVIDAMTSHRPYNTDLEIDDALSEITKNMGTYYEPVVVNACLWLFSRQRQYRDAMSTANDVHFNRQPIRCRG